MSFVYVVMCELRYHDPEIMIFKRQEDAERYAEREMQEYLGLTLRGRSVSQSIGTPNQRIILLIKH